MDKPLIIYHANCMDGMGAAWAAKHYFESERGVEVGLHPANYGSLPPDVTGRDVFIVDFSYPRDTLEFMRASARSIVVLDHHKTAEQDLRDLPLPPTIREYELIWKHGEAPPKDVPNLFAEFDMNRSGAGMSWDFFNRNKPRPTIINRIEDRDLWKFEQPDTRAIHACLASYAMDDFETFNKLVWEAEGGGYEKLVAEGWAIDRRHLQIVKENILVSQRVMKIGGVFVPVVNAPYALASDTGNLLCKGQPFAATYIDSEKGRHFSLRSSDEGLDVSEIAKKYGGGGHRNAAGFTRPSNWEGDPE